VAGEFLTVDDDLVVLVDGPVDEHVRAADGIIHLPDLARRQLRVGAVDRRRGRGLVADDRAFFLHAAVHARAVELPGERGVAGVVVGFDQQVIGRVVLEPEVHDG